MSPGNQSTIDKIITVKEIISTIAVEVVLVTTITMKGLDLTAPALISVWKIPIPANHPIMKITTIIP